MTAQQVKELKKLTMMANNRTLNKSVRASAAKKIVQMYIQAGK